MKCKIMSEDKFKIILKNDGKTSFQTVIESLVKVCNHNIMQAEQCALITHLKGECEIKNNLSFEETFKYIDELDAIGLKIEYEL